MTLATPNTLGAMQSHHNQGSWCDITNTWSVRSNTRVVGNITVEHSRKLSVTHDDIKYGRCVTCGIFQVLIVGRKTGSMIAIPNELITMVSK